MMDVIILCGGFGTRMKSISKGIPKPLLPVGDRVLLDYIIDWLTNSDINRIILSLYYKPEIFNSYLDKIHVPVKISSIVEPQPLGTGGAVNFVLKAFEISEPFIVINGDTLVDFKLKNMVDGFKAIDCPAMIGIYYMKNTRRYGAVNYKDNIAISFDEKKRNQSGWINIGCYIFNKSVFDESDGAFSIEKDFFPRLVEQKKLSVYPIVDGEFWDIGVSKDYYKFVKKFSNIG